MDSLNYASATALAAAIRALKVSSAEVVDTHLERIEAVNSKLNAVVQLDAEGAQLRAREADAALARGEALGPLHGVPFTVKDWIETEGLVCAAGVKERASYVPNRDATVVARMRAAGAVLLGKTVDGSKNEVYGPSYNPYDLERTPGGSSTGEAIIIASGGSPAGLGSDSGGSIRYPAHCCGVAGLKPTTGRVPLTGHFPRIGSLSDPRTQIGPLARYIEDLALLLSIISGPDWRDPSVVPVPLGDMRDVELPGLRAAVFTVFDGASPTPATEATVRSAAQVLADAGVEIEDAVPPRIEESLDITRRYWRRVRSHSWNEWRAPSESTLSADEIERSIFDWERFRRAFVSFMERYDFIICPVSGAPAALRYEESPELVFIYTLPFSLTGWPAAVVRAGTSPEGLPIGVQLAARPWRDDVALAAAAHIESALGGWQPPTAHGAFATLDPSP